VLGPRFNCLTEERKQSAGTELKRRTGEKEILASSAIIGGAYERKLATLQDGLAKGSMPEL